MQLTGQDFERSNWEEVIPTAAQKVCWEYTVPFRNKAIEAKAAGDDSLSEVFLFLSQIAYLRLQSESPDKPFDLIQDLNSLDANNLDILKLFVKDIKDAEMRARVADVLWLRKRDYRFAELALDSYLESARILEDPKEWVDCASRIERAVRLSASLNKGVPSTKATAHIEAVLAKYQGNDPLFLSARLMEILQQYQQGDISKYSALAEKAAVRAEAEFNWHKARSYWTVKAGWHRQGEDRVNEHEALKHIAVTYVQEAESAAKQSPSSYMKAAHFLQQAIEAYRRIGEKAEADELHKKLIVYERESLKELKPITAAPIDLGEMILKAQQAVQGKLLPEAIRILAFAIPFPTVVALHKQTEDLRSVAPLQFLIPKATLNKMGKVTTRTATSEDDDAIRPKMFEIAAELQNFNAQRFIHPARLQIHMEHCIRVDDLLPFLFNNPFVPEGRERIFAQGLHAGFLGDYLTAVHLLIPQLENSIRFVLSREGVIVSGLDSEGIQEEHDLSRLLYAPELKTIFGEDIVFELQGLLIERSGTNLRNLLAHGLLDFDEFWSPRICYVWWLALRLCLSITYHRKE